MTNTRAIVTIVIGDSYLQQWQRLCEPNWRQYAEKYGFDVVCLQEPLDTSERALRRSPSWQKCLIFSQDHLRRYERIVWIDSDILINNNLAPDIVDGVPAAMVGGAEHLPFSHTRPEIGREVLKRASEYWHDTAVTNETAEEYYTRYGLPSGCDQVLNAGVMVTSPMHHREMFEDVYNRYEERGGREWHMEMRPLSYELVKAGLVHWIDPRYNLMWPDLMFLHYPFLLKPALDSDLAGRVKRKFARSMLNIDVARHIRSACVNAGFQSSFFFHFGGPNIGDMDLIDRHARSWMDVDSGEHDRRRIPGASNVLRHARVG
jgi:hypothetical protein